MKKYFKDINQNYSLINLFKYAVILSTLLLIIDILNLPSKYLLADNMSLSLLITGSIILILILTALEFGLLDTLKLATINVIDKFSVIIMFSFIIYGSITPVYDLLYFDKLIGFIGIVCFLIIIIFTRSIYLKSKIEHVEKYTPNIVDLREIYNNNFTVEKDEPILVEEEEVNYDLLERKNIINQLYSAIIRSKPDGKFVISLEGEWGSGKTTIINNVKRKLKETKENLIIIDEFDPWSYSDQRSLFYHMFDIIIQKSGFKFSTLATRKMAKEISENIFGLQKSSRILKSFFKNQNNINILKNKINNYLKQCGKKVVFFIDNIDRIESDNIILLFKLVGNILDFNRVTYVLSFDNKRIKKIFDNDLSIDYQYLKKVIQMQIRVPEVSRKALSKLFKKCLNNLLIEYGENEENLNYYDCIIDFMCEQKIDVRDFKRFINSVISFVFSGSSYLNKRDMMIIEYIRLYNFPLYQQIHQNGVYFISHDKRKNKEAYAMSLRKEEFNRKAKKFFDELFSNKNNSEYIDILAEVFPYVDRYKNNNDLEYDGVYVPDGSYSNIVKTKRICSAKYFNLYFTNTENDFVLIGELIESFVDDLNQTEDFDSRMEVFNTLLNSIHSSYHKETFERFQFYIEDLKKDVLFDLVTILFDKIYKIDDFRAFIALTARSRVEVIIWELLQKINDAQYNEFLNSIENKYGKIEIISSILYWFRNDREGKNVEGRKEEMQSLYEEMGNYIIENKINIYDDLYYHPKNVWGLGKLYEENQKKFKNYIKRVVDEENIFKLIYDCITLPSGTEYKYSIRKENLENLITEEEIDNILEKTEPSTDDQQFIIDVYKTYKTDSTNSFGEEGIITERLKDLNP